MQLFCPNNDRIRPDRFQRLALQKPCKFIKWIRISHDHIGPIAVHPFEVLTHPFRGEFETTENQVSIEPVMQVHLQAFPSGNLTNGSPPDVKLLCPGSGSGPAIATIRHRRTPVIAAAVQIKLQRFTTGTTGRLCHSLDVGSCSQLQSVTPNHIAGQ